MIEMSAIRKFSKLGVGRMFLIVDSFSLELRRRYPWNSGIDATPFEQSSNGINTTNFKLFNTLHHDKQPPEVVVNNNKTMGFCQEKPWQLLQCAIITMACF